MNHFLSQLTKMKIGNSNIHVCGPGLDAHLFEMDPATLIKVKMHSNVFLHVHSIDKVSNLGISIRGLALVHGDPIEMNQSQTYGGQFLTRPYL